ncbi:transcriptional adapter 3 [Drosophila takahashii]|uniref:transcriptional adapter 3 n=1 Tax=Drosophila takahashii TaxID=29030 RepID=UPI001CF87257|nr:transcriptional adapter 3 [Drosophila takahashii]
MSANLKNMSKLAHFGAPPSGSAGFGLSASSSSSGGAGKLPTNGQNGGKSNPPTSSSASSTTEELLTTPSGIAIPIIRTRDVARLLPTIATALQRPSDDHLAAEDLDAVQLELEQMLSNVALRTRVLKSEYDSLDKDEKRQDRRKLDRVPGSPPCGTSMLNGLLGMGSNSSGSLGSPLSGGAGQSASQTKRKRDEPTGVRKKHSSMTISSKNQAKNSPLTVHTDDSMDYLPTLVAASASGSLLPHHQPQLPQLPKVAVPKNDTPNKFWLSVEPYCMPLTNEDLRLIDDLLEQYRGPLVPPVPPLGPHYSTAWAQEDMKAMQPGGARIKSQNASGMIKKAEGMAEVESITGPLTQRLVSALMEESLMTLPSEQAAVGEHSNSTTTTSGSNENTHSSSSANANNANANAAAAASAGNFRSLAMMKHGVGIEQRLKKTLIENGLIDASELAAHEDVDEVLMEIKRVTTEISAISQFNSEELKRLRSAASEEIKRIAIKRKLDTVDQEILECYKRMLQYRAKRKGHTIEEKQEILRLTNEQRLLADQLERMQMHLPTGGGGGNAGGSLLEQKM